MCVCVWVYADRVQRQEREVMLKLKEVVDKQRDELRAKVQEITTISKEVEAVRRHSQKFKCSSAYAHRYILSKKKKIAKYVNIVYQSLFNQIYYYNVVIIYRGIIVSLSSFCL